MSAQFYISIPPKNRNTQKTFGFMTFSGGVQMEHWAKMGLDGVL